SKEELLTFLDQCAWCVMNDYESQLLMNTTDQTIEALVSRVEALVVTRGGEGSVVHTDGKTIEIPSVTVEKAVDPTGCGDAYRAGLLYGLEQGWDWEVSGRVGALLGAIKVEHEGTQNHRFTRDEFDSRFEENFGSPPA
ncbi:MAG: PfkB family carbohydrate kinase, partial [Arenicellales bacterium]|nr:PfkB family carbohydrate kinase [Arenicellales bacterium]